MIDYNFHIRLFGEGDLKARMLAAGATPVQGILIREAKRNGQMAYIEPLESISELDFLIKTQQALRAVWKANALAQEKTAETSPDKEDKTSEPEAKTLLKELGIEEQVLHLNIGYRYQCNFEMSAETMAEIAKMGLVFTFSCYEQEIEKAGVEGEV